MNTILLTIIGLWLLNAAFETLLGLLQILTGVILGTFGSCLWLLSFVAEYLENLWRTAFPKSHTPTSNEILP